MKEKQLTITIQTFDRSELAQVDQTLLNTAQKSLDNAYSPYSNFKVAASILLENGEIVTGNNQENAAYPMCVCAEVVALNACSALFPKIPIQKIFITIKSPIQITSKPVAPCGQCRQTILEYENRFNKNIEIWMTAETGEVWAVKSVKDLLPLNFSQADL